MYTAYLWQQYDSIQEQVAQGQGEHLEAIARFSGCTEPVTRNFQRGISTKLSIVI